MVQGKIANTTQCIRESLCEILELNQVDDTKSFQDYGMDSVSGMRFAILLEKKMTRKVAPEWLIDFPTVEALSQQIVHQEESKIAL